MQILKTACVVMALICITLVAVGEASAQDYRTTFAYANGSFERIAAGSWEENRDDGSVSKFIEVTRTAGYVELYDRDREFKVRLYNGVGKWYSKEAKDWVSWPGSQGRWR